jgi:hypothetical protein
MLLAVFVPLTLALVRVFLLMLLVISLIAGL